ncbi:hypothetical protein BJY24_003213 [Nocardia transvalensis]|uniref:Uncharacterized protein n=1 Tax=Nocardia transvalensis TaxID=37333 RepID=A0A7W9PE76_9NOCA|nr:hypothetical protein [Nocardia transvalensis]MBB5914346.1 hypothetical protein [Nocardia transvalensis]
MKNSIDKYLRQAHIESASARISRIATRAARAGYLLVRGRPGGREWALLDAGDGEVVYSAARLEEIEGWLDT